MKVELITHWWDNYSYKYKGKTIEIKSSPYNFSSAFISSTKSKQQITKILKDNKFIPDLIHLHTHTFQHDSAMTELRNEFKLSPIVYTLHQLIPHAKMKKEELDKLSDVTEEELEMMKSKYYDVGIETRNKAQKEIIEYSDGIISISKTQESYFKKLFPKYGGESIAIENGVDYFIYLHDDKIMRIREELLDSYNLRNNRVIIYVGRIERDKGYQRMVKAFYEFMKGDSSGKYKNTKLIFVGGQSPNAIAQIKAEGLDDDFIEKNILITPWESDRQRLAAWYSIATAMVMPMFTEELYPMVAKEAIAMGLPVISCKGEMTIGQSKTKEDIIQSLYSIFDNTEEIGNHIIKAFGILMEKHSIYKSVEEHLDFYNLLINRKVKSKSGKETTMKSDKNLERKNKMEEMLEKLKNIPDFGEIDDIN